MVAPFRVRKAVIFGCGGEPIDPWFLCTVRTKSWAEGWLNG